MTKKIIFAFILCCSINSTFGQNKTIVINSEGTAFVIESVPVIADFSKPIVLSFEGDTLPANFKVSTTDNTISEPVFHADNRSYTFDVWNKSAEQVIIQITGKGLQPYKMTIKNSNIVAQKNMSDTLKYTPTYSQLFSRIPAYSNINKRYNRKENEAYFFFNEKGMLLGSAPVNIDADDYLIVYMVVPKSQSSSYFIQVDGDYNPSDLSIRPYEKIYDGAMQGTGRTSETEYSYIVQKFGPFTSDKVTIRFFNGENELPNHQEVRINKLYHVAIGASFISTNLEKPSFELFPIAGSTNNTINTVNTGNRTLVTFNIIYYWKPTIDWVTGKLNSKTNITRGRDILKEATFWERLNPTFGVAINNEWRENFFIGANFEFTRGGSITAGWHYGKIQKLADSNFKLGTDIFAGTKNDIILTDTWQTGFFFGITLDTRLFNRLFTSN